MKNKMCELCGVRPAFETHHIIPKCAGGGNEADNVVSVCRRCHAILTPKTSLTKYGLNKRRRKNQINDLFIDFYNEVSEALEEDTPITGAEIIDMFCNWERKTYDTICQLL